ncbi:MAG: cohesin domain-containing protein [Saprospiraceae bacterium]
MKRLYSSFLRFRCGVLAFALVFFQQAGSGQTSCFSLGIPTVAGGQSDIVTVPVTVQNFQDILSLGLELSWPATDLEFASPLTFGANPLGLTAANFNTNTPGLLKFTFFDQNGLGIDLPDGSVIFNIRLRIKTFEAKFVPIRLENDPSGIIPEVVSEPGGILSVPLRGGGVYANMPPAAPPIVETICTTVSTSDCQNPTGSITITVTGGTSPYVYQWGATNGVQFSTTQNLTDLPYGFYYLTVTDAVGATAQASVFIASEEIPLALSGQVQNTSCSGDDGCINLTPSTSQWPVSFAWSTTNMSQNHCSLAPGTYTVTATDAGGCSVTKSFEVVADGVLAINMFVSPANCANGQFGSAVALPQNGAPPYQYLWSNNTVGQLNQALNSGPHTITVTDSEGCSAVKTIIVSDAATQAWGLDLFPHCLAVNEGNMVLYSWNSAALRYPVTVEWGNGTTVIAPSAGDTLAILADVPSGLYTALVTDSIGCALRIETALNCLGSAPPDSAALIWPGDADNNSAVNHHDLLYLGLAYGQSGPTRPAATNDWTGQPAPDWPQNTPGRVVNFKNMDTNGDGTVSAADTVAIAANWGRVVDPLADAPFAAPADVPGTAGPALNLPADTLYAGQTTFIPVVLGSLATPADDLHGLAFSISYNPKILQPLYFEPMASWFGDPADGLLCLQRHFPGQNRIDVALSRTDGIPVSGYGIIGKMFIIIEDDIFFKKDLGEPESENEATITTRLFARNIRGLAPSNTPFGLPALESRLVISQTVGTEPELLVSHGIVLWPNPAAHEATITCPDAFLRSVTVTDMASRLKYRAADLADYTVTIPVQTWAPGTYLVQAQTTEGVFTRLLVIVN